MNLDMSGRVPLAPSCPRCRRRHLVDLPCWIGEHRKAATRALFDTLEPPYRCWLCGKPGANQADHVRARSRGGDDRPANLRPAHHGCNSARGNRDPFRPDPPVPPGLEVSPRFRRYRR